LLLLLLFWVLRVDVSNFVHTVHTVYPMSIWAALFFPSLSYAHLSIFSYHTGRPKTAVADTTARVSKLIHVCFPMFN
jgi:hypothetical protein